jgi:hypothetical protein
MAFRQFKATDRPRAVGKKCRKSYANHLGLIFSGGGHFFAETPLSLGVQPNANS